MVEDKMSSKAWQELNKAFGNKMFRGDEDVKFDIPVIPFPSPTLADASHFGGVPYGKISQFHGPEGCLSADTFIPYRINDASGKRINSKGGTIEHLYRRFHGIKTAGKGYGKSHELPDGATFSIASIDDENRIFHNQVVDVVKTGRKACITIKVGGREITATKDHKFWVGDKFVAAGDLKVGDIVYIHNNTHYKEKNKKRHSGGDRPEVFVKYHPTNGRIKKVYDAKIDNTYEYYRIRRSRAVVEAHMNGLSLDEYVERLNNRDVEGLKTLRRDQHVHHLDEDWTNDDISNLAIIDPVEHNRGHALAQQHKMSFTAVPAEVLEIEDAGEQDTYDIKMPFPYNNYVANGFVVHNSGKTFMAMLTAKQVMDEDPSAEVMWFDCEHSFNREWAELIELDMTRFHYSDENVGAEVFSMICGKPSKTGKGKGTPGILDLNKEGALNVKLIVIDSIAALIPPAEMDRAMEELEMAALARFMPKALRVTSAKLSQTDTALLCINHAKEAIGDNVNKYTYPGGRGLRYMLSLVVLFDTTQSKSATLFDEDEHKYGHRVDCTIEKTRGGPNKWKAKIWFNFRDGCIAKLGEEVALLGEAYGVVDRPNATAWVYNDVKISGKDNFFEYLDENPEIRDEIVEKCKQIKAEGGSRKAELAEGTEE